MCVYHPRKNTVFLDTVSSLLFSCLRASGAWHRLPHPAEKTTCPNFQSLCHSSWLAGHPATPPLAGAPPRVSVVPSSGYLLAQTVYQHGAEHWAARRNTHGNGGTSPQPAINTFLQAVCRCLSWAYTHICTNSCQHSWASSSCTHKPLGFAKRTPEFTGPRTSRATPSDLGRPTAACCCKISGSEFNLSERQMLHDRLGILITSRR